jgi:hypothetical protein
MWRSSFQTERRGPTMLIGLSLLLLIAACLALRELVAVRREVSSTRQFLVVAESAPAALREWHVNCLAHDPHATARQTYLRIP